MPTPFCTYEQLVAAYDANVVAGLSSDTKTVNPGPNAIIDELILQAQGTIMMYVRTANRYTDAQMEALAVAKDPALARIAVDLTMELLFNRRARQAIPDAVSQRIKQTYALLTALAKGSMIFPTIAGAVDAGLPASTVPGADYYNPNVGAYNTANLALFGPLRGGQSPYENPLGGGV